MFFGPEIRQLLQLAGVHTDPEVFMVVWLLATARLAAAAPFIPFLGRDPIPGPIVLPLAGLFALLLCPSLTPDLTSAPPFSQFVAILFKEILVGVLIGVFVQIVFSAVEAAGTMIEYTAGLKQQEILAPQNPAAQGPLGLLFGNAAIVLYLSAGVHLLLLRAVADSYSVLPLLETPTFAAGFPALATAAGRITVGFLITAVQIAIPVVLILVFLRLTANMAMKLAFPSGGQDPLQPVGSLALYGVLFLGVGIMSGEIVRQAGSILFQLRQLILSMR